jgi:hypothetical protein
MSRYNEKQKKKYSVEEQSEKSKEIITSKEVCQRMRCRKRKSTLKEDKIGNKEEKMKDQRCRKKAKRSGEMRSRAWKQIRVIEV